MTQPADAPVAAPGDPGTSPVMPAPTPVGDFGSSAFWTSPSSYITIATFLLPVLATVFHKDFTQYAQAISQLAPLVATAVLLVMRGSHKRAVLVANTQLAIVRLQQQPPADASVLNLQAQVDAMKQLLSTPAVTTNNVVSTTDPAEPMSAAVSRRKRVTKA